MLVFNTINRAGRQAGEIVLVAFRGKEHWSFEKNKGQRYLHDFSVWSTEGFSWICNKRWQQPQKLQQRQEALSNLSCVCNNLLNLLEGLKQRKGWLPLQNDRGACFLLKIRYSKSKFWSVMKSPPISASVSHSQCKNRQKRVLVKKRQQAGHTHRAPVPRPVPTPTLFVPSHSFLLKPKLWFSWNIDQNFVFKSH